MKHWKSAKNAGIFEALTADGAVSKKDGQQQNFLLLSIFRYFYAGERPAQTVSNGCEYGFLEPIQHFIYARGLFLLQKAPSWLWLQAKANSLEKCASQDKAFRRVCAAAGALPLAPAIF